MEIKEKLNFVYKSYKEGDFIKAKKVNDEILSLEPNNIYAKRYDSFLVKKITSTNPGKSIKTKGKTMKCPHCTAKIALSSLTQEQVQSIKSGNYNNLELKCPYCHTIFVLQKKRAYSILGLKIGHKLEIGNMKYRLVGYAEYSGRWFEGNYYGKTHYLEWILLGEDNSYKYFSEGYSIDEGKKEFEFELSYKITPTFTINADYSGNTINISGGVKNFSGSCKLKVKSVYGENSKSYTIGEDVELYDFSHSGKKYVIEKEGVGRQMEAGIYETTTLSKGTSLKLFNIKNIPNKLKDNNTKSSISARYDNDKEYKNILKLMIFIPFSFIVLTFLVFKPLFGFLQPKAKVDLKNVAKGTFDLKYNIDKGRGTVSKTIKYDYGGVKSYYQKREGIKFSVESKEDLEIINKLTNMSNKKKLLNITEEKTRKIFQEGLIYKIN